MKTYFPEGKKGKRKRKEKEKKKNVESTKKKKEKRKKDEMRLYPMTSTHKYTHIFFRRISHYTDTRFCVRILLMHFGIDGRTLT